LCRQARASACTHAPHPLSCTQRVSDCPSHTHTPQELLEGNLSICKANVKSADKDIEVIRDNVTTLEVSLSRVWNFDVERRRSATTNSKES